jgi:isopenicillin-N epimerase
MDTELRSFFFITPEVIFLNHGSFGACPRPVLEDYQAWQLRLERQPVEFLGREFRILMRAARQALAEHVGADRDDLVYVPNATHGVNIVARSLALQPGDEVLASDHEYGACDRTWQFICQQKRAKYVRQAVALPVKSEDEMLDQVWSGVTDRTKLIFISHISSPTAIRFPVEAICARARQHGILTLVDGAHAPGQLELDLDGLGADFYTGNCHKWLLAPKGAGFLFARRQVQDLIQPLVVSWGYQAASDFTTGSRFVDLLEWTGTHDPAAALAVSAALRFIQAHDWRKVREQCHGLLRQALIDISALTGLPLVCPLDRAFFIQMAVAELPRLRDLAGLKAALYDRFRIEVPLIDWNGRHFIRISVQGYNTRDDLDALLDAMRVLLPEFAA